MSRRGRETGALIKSALDGIVNVYPHPAVEGVKYPYLTYNLDIAPTYTKDGVAYEAVNAALRLFTAFDGEGYDMKVEICNRIDAVLLAVPRNYNGFNVSKIRIVSETETFGDNFRMQELIYNLIVEQ